MVTRMFLKGIITPSGWDLKGNIEAISLQTVDEDEFLIEKNRLEVKLRDRINSMVKVKGKVRERIDGKKSLSVREFEIVDDHIGQGTPQMQ